MDQLLARQLFLLFSLGALSIFHSHHRSTLVDGTKIDCYPIDGASEEQCQSLGCIWSPVQGSKNRQDHGPVAQLSDSGTVDGALKGRVDVPWCYFPTDYMGYSVTSEPGPSNLRLRLKRVKPSALGADVNELLLDLTESRDGNTLRLKIYDAHNDRFEPQLPELSFEPAQKTPKDDMSGRGFKVELVETDDKSSKTRLVIKRKSSGAILFAADLGKIIFSDKFIQLTNQLDSSYVYGLGEHFDSFLKWVSSDQYKVYSMYNTDQHAVPDGQRSYGGFPFYINLDSANRTQAHGVYLRNSNAMDVILHPTRSVTFRPTGGVLDFFIFLGPSANQVVGQYQSLVGRPQLPPRWSLGFHLCRYNYGSLNKTRLVWSRTRDSGIPFDVQWNDIDYMDRYNDFTYDPANYAELPNFVNELHQAGQQYVILFDPGVSQEANYEPYELGEKMDIFIKDSSNKTLVGRVWNSSGRTVFPDFSNPKSHEYWAKLFADFHQQVPFDGAWIDMNDISSFVDGSLDGCPWSEAIESPPYRPGGLKLQHHSLCLSAKHQAGLEYDLHNLYSQYEAIATKRALETARPGRRALIISRSTSPGQGRFGGHWSGDVQSTWEDLRWSIPSLLEHSIYGFSLMGTDICGFTGNTTVELCARWSTLGAFYTFSRNHNDDVSIDQDPVALGQLVVDANKNALTKRYSLLPYLYSLMQQASRFGQLAVRSVPLEFHAEDPQSLRVEHQFMWGKALMISPIVFPDTWSKMTYLPPGRWYETDILPDNDQNNPKVPKPIDSQGGSGAWFRTDNVSLINLPLFYRGGYILPVYPRVQQTIKQLVQQPVGLEIALCQMGRAEGELYHDDGETLDSNDYQLFQMRVTNSRLQVMTDSDSADKIQFDLIKVYGVAKKVAKVEIVASEGASTQLKFDQFDHMLVFNLGAIKAVKGAPIVVQWQ